MSKETRTRKQRLAITSDRWHVVRATRRMGVGPRFVRSIVSEHEEKAAAMVAADALAVALESEMAGRPPAERDHVFVRKPHFKSVKVTSRRPEGL